jgi:propionyl-CoA carboxylase alpha chain
MNARRITCVLVANRGEVARRVFRTCRDLGLSTVAVFSDADADALHAAEADLAVRLPGSAAADTYLREELVIKAAHAAGADAVHPGYGFLSESAAFAQAVADAGLVWVGPSPGAVAAMGSKLQAKRLMAAAGVPVLPALDPDAVTQADLPVLVKASAGGGGRGMRLVHRLGDLAHEAELASGESLSAFGDPTVFCEPFLAAGRHIEVQVVADDHGTVWTVGERECSIQRRHQKVLEETPSPLVGRLPGLREALFSAARAAAEAIGYTGAGTVEFLVDDTGRFSFLEMNTRLQVEHPVTECTTGLDLVALQIQVAQGGRLAPAPPAPAGHAIEARLYAEDPAASWRPQSGTLYRFAIPGVTVELDSSAAPSGVRVDSGVADGSTVSVHYDAMLAKVVAWAPDRRQAASLLAASLARADLHGLANNRDLLVNVLRHEAFLAGDTDTSFLDRHDVAGPLLDETAERTCALAAALALDAAAKGAAPVLGRVPSGWRNVVSQPQRLDLRGPHATHQVRYLLARHGLTGEVDGHPVDGVALVEATPTRVVLEDDLVRRTFTVARYGDQVYVGTHHGSVPFTVADRFPDRVGQVGRVGRVGQVGQVALGSLVAPMPGSVTRIGAAVGDLVAAGQPVLWLEAMKMQHQITTPTAGVLTELRVEPGQQVEPGTVLAVVSDPTGGTP